MKTDASARIRTFRLRLPQSVYDVLREEAARLDRPAAVVAREAIEAWLAERKGASMREAIAAYAVAHAGSATDLDAALERASLDLLRGRTFPIGRTFRSSPR